MLTKRQQLIKEWYEQKMLKERIFELINIENDRQDRAINLVASENYASDDVMKVIGNVNLMSKYTEGYPYDRYYGGCSCFDNIESICRNAWEDAFRTNYYVNVQPHSGSNANLAAYLAAGAVPGQSEIIAFNPSGIGHLTHGAKVNFSGKFFYFDYFGLNEKGKIDYNKLSDLMDFHPNLTAIMIGYSSLSEEIDYERIYKLLKEHYYSRGKHPYFIADISHTAGFILTGMNKSPFGYADIITTTTHKTLRGPRGGLIFCKPDLFDQVNAAVFPGIQGGALQNIIAGKAIAATECNTQKYRDYIAQVNDNAVAMQQVFHYHGFDTVGNDLTSNHMFIVDFSKTHEYITGMMVQQVLENQFDIIVNKQVIPGDKRTPKQTSGIRIGTAAATTKGMTKKEAEATAEKICGVIDMIQEISTTTILEQQDRK